MKPQPSRFDKAIEMNEAGAVTQTGENVYKVKSQSKPGVAYTVTANGFPRCTCEDFIINHKPCKHAIAALAPRLAEFVFQLYKVAISQSDVGIIYDYYWNEIKKLHPAFVAIARNELASARERFSCAAAIAA